MASITMEAVVRAPAETVWRALANVGDAHRVFAGVLTDCRSESNDTRTVTFANGLAVTERIIDVDPVRKRIAYTVVTGGFEYHGASMRISDMNDRGCLFEWTCDVLPDAAADRIRPLMDAGIAALKRTFDQA